MTGLEVPGLVLAVGSVAIAFKSAIDTALLIDSFSDEKKSDCQRLALCYHIEKTRLQLWGRFHELDKDFGPQEGVLENYPREIKEIVIRVLGEIEKLNKEAEKLVEKHGIDLAKLPHLDLDDNLKLDAALPSIVAKKFVKPKARFRWAIQSKDEFKAVVSNFQRLINDLHRFTLHPPESVLLSKALPSYVVARVGDSGLLRTLGHSNMTIAPEICVSAHAKWVRQTNLTEYPTSVSFMATNQLTFLKGSSNIAILTKAAEIPRSVWVEWNRIESGSDSEKYISRIRSLGCFLEHVSKPALRLPSFHGIYEDLRYEEEYGQRRFGYVFGTPQIHENVVRHDPLYEGNLRDYPPKSLSALLRDVKSPPMLGDRFRLASTLATSFSHFHAAGWLHRGFHSENIIFLERADDAGIVLTEPFITGFQYSRPHNEASLARGPLENSKLQHYYHPEAESGFNKRYDLYGLGVVLCEIGRWSLVFDPVRQSTKSKFKNRKLWKEYMETKVAEDMGWRMGKKYQSVVRTLLAARLPSDDDDAHFAQEYFDKVIRPLSECSV